MTDEPERDDDAETHEQEEKQAASPGGGTAEADETEAEPLSKPEDDEGVEFELRELEEVAAENQEALKEGGDWQVFPRVALDFAAGRFGHRNGELYFLDDGWTPVRTVIYRSNGRELVPR